MLPFARAALFVAALILIPLAALSAPQIGLSWNRCDVLETAHPVVGADRVAHMIVFADGLDAPVLGFELTIQIHSLQVYKCSCAMERMELSPAWSFEAGGCQGPDRLHAIFGPADAGCAALPPSQLTYSNLATVRDSGNCPFVGACPSAQETISLQALGSSPWTAPPRTAVWRIDFDLAGSCAFAPSGSECCRDDLAMSLVASGSVLMADHTYVDLGQARLTYAADAVPTRPVTWGSLKAIYR
jgi:hypothetical protein